MKLKVLSIFFVLFFVIPNVGYAKGIELHIHTNTIDARNLDELYSELGSRFGERLYSIETVFPEKFSQYKKKKFQYFVKYFFGS